MEWKQVKQYKWEILDQGFDGTAHLQETNSGFIASISVENTDFDMELLDEREFFEKKKDAISFLKEKMTQESY